MYYKFKTEDIHITLGRYTKKKKKTYHTIHPIVLYIHNAMFCKILDGICYPTAPEEPVPM